MKLHHQRYLEWFEGPILSILTDDEGNLYVEKWADRFVTILVRTTQERLDRYTAGKISMLDLLTKPDDRGWLVTYSPMFRDEEKKLAECVVSQVKAEYLPTHDAMYDPSLTPDNDDE